MQPILELRGAAEMLGLAEELKQAKRWRRSLGASMRGPARNRSDNEAQLDGTSVGTANCVGGAGRKLVLRANLEKWGRELGGGGGGGKTT